MLEREEINKMGGLSNSIFSSKNLIVEPWAGLSRPRKEDKDDYISGDGLSKARGGIGNQANTIRTNRE